MRTRQSLGEISWQDSLMDSRPSPSCSQVSQQLASSRAKHETPLFIKIRNYENASAKHDAQDPLLFLLRATGDSSIDAESAGPSTRDHACETVMLPARPPPRSLLQPV